METQRCDRCDAMIVRGPGHGPKRARQITIEDGEHAYTTVERVLCQSCEEAFLEWIDEGTDGPGGVDLPHRLRTGAVLRNVAEELESIADTVDAELNNDGSND